MPFLLLDDAADEATRRLQQFGTDQLTNLSAVRQGAQSAAASAQDVTQRLMQFGQGQLDSLQQQAQVQVTSNLSDITGRLQDFGSQQLQELNQPVQQAAQQAQAAVQGGLQPLQQLQPLAPPSAPPAPQGQSLDQTQPTQPQGGGAIDSSSVENFARTFSPYAQAAAQALGIDPSWVTAMAGSESNYGKAGGNELFGVKALPGQKGTTMMTHEGEYGGRQQNATFAAYDTPQDAVDAWVNLIKNHYPGAVNAPDLATFVHGLKQGGYFTAAEPEYRDILSSIQKRVAPFVEGAGQVVQQGTQAVQQAGQNLQQQATSKLGDISQFGDKQLTNAEAYAACGPAAAVRFAQLFGRNPTLREAVDLASKVGWTAANGMAGLGSESNLFDAMDIPHRQVGADWNALAKEAQSGNPVVISTPGHYFTADGYDPNTGAFHVGRSGTDLRQGSEWMTPAQMENVMGKLQGGLAADNPLVPGGSPLSQGTGGAPSGGPSGGLEQAKQKGLQILDQALPLAGDLATGGLTRRFNQNLQDLTQHVLGVGQVDSSQDTSVPLPSLEDLRGGVGKAVEDFAYGGPISAFNQNPREVGEGVRDTLAPYMPPGVLDSLQTLQELNDKYTGTAGAQTIPMKGQEPLTLSVDPSVMTPDDRERYEQARGAVAGLATAFVDQPTLTGIRGGGVIPGPSPIAGGRGPIATAVDVTKQFMLSNPSTHVGNTIGNTLELLRSPVALTLGGRPLDALAGIGATTRALPDATVAALQALRGTAPASLGSAAQTSRWWQPVYKALGAADQFTRTLGEYQGMAEHASYLLRQAGIDPASAGAQPFLASHAAEITDAGRRAGGNSVFQMQRTATGGLGFLDDLANRFGHYKEGLLSSPSNRDQLLGALLDTQIPFSGVPSRILQIGTGRLPGISQVSGASRAIQAARVGDYATMQREIGNTLMESAIQVWIAEQVREGNIRGPDDPDHPGEVNLLGNWVNGGLLGAYALPAMIMAAAAEGFGKPLTRPTEGAGDAVMQRMGNALASSMKPFVQAIPGMQMVHFLGALGEGPGTAFKGELQDTINRITAPGAAKFIEDVTDPTQRDVSQGLAGLWETPMARWPGLAQMLPARIDPTTGEPMEKRRSGPGIVLGAESWDESRIREEGNRLVKAGYPKATPPSTYPDQVTVGRSIVTLKPDEQRAVAEITGKMLGNFAARLDEPGYKNAPIATQARMMEAYLNAADRAKVSAALKVLGRPELMRRAALGQKDIGGRLVNQGPPVNIEIPSLEDLQKQAGQAA